jgi:hypothetical protein
MRTILAPFLHRGLYPTRKPTVEGFTLHFMTSQRQEDPQQFLRNASFGCASSDKRQDQSRLKRWRRQFCLHSLCPTPRGLVKPRRSTLIPMRSMERGRTRLECLRRPQRLKLSVSILLHDILRLLSDLIPQPRWGSAEPPAPLSSSFEPPRLAASLRL